MSLSLNFRSLLTAILAGLSVALAASIPPVPGDSGSMNTRAFVNGTWSLVQHGTTGVSAMQMAVVSESTVIIIDRQERNSLTVNGHAAWASELNLNTTTVRSLNPLSNTFCATGSFLGNGTLLSSGGSPPAAGQSGRNGYQGLRLFTPCTDRNCDIYEDPANLHTTSNRLLSFFGEHVRLEDGSVLILGGSIDIGYINGPTINGPTINNPTYEFFPPKNINGFNGVQIPSKFLNDTLNSNHFPIVMQLPDGNLFVAANQDAMILNWKDNTERRLPGIPNGVRVTSPFSAGAALLPLTPENGYTPEVMICGGSTVSDSRDPVGAGISSQTPASAQCSRMVLTDAGIAKGWSVETMPEARVMPELIHLPDQRIVIVSGAHTGVAGFGNVKDLIGISNADHPASTPVIYDPQAAEGSRFSSEGIPATTIPRMYHSTVTLTPNGTIMLAGSNPNNGVSTSTVKYPTEYRLEFYSPPYMFQPRPSYTGLPVTVDYNSIFILDVTLPDGVIDVSVALMDLGFATHGVHMDSRFVKLFSVLSLDRKTLIVTGPPSNRIYPPGPAFLYVVTDGGVPSFGHKTIIGTAASPPVDLGAIGNLLANAN